MSLDVMNISRYVTKKQPWKMFFIKLCVLAFLIVFFGGLFANRYRIGIDPQFERCLPNNFIYLIDLKDKRLYRNGIYAFYSKGLNPIFKDGTRMLKILVGLPGDTIEVNKKYEILVNGNVVASGLHLASKLGRTKDSFIGKTTLGSNQLWFLGESIESFDSRYWGAATTEKLIGRSYAIY